MKFLKKRRSEIKQAVIKALENGNIFYLPLKIKAIVRSFSNIRLIPFSKHMKKQGYVRSNLSDETYDMLEAEADYFAQLILVPHYRFDF